MNRLLVIRRFMCTRDLVARRKRQRTRSGGPARKQREAVPGFSVVPVGVVPTPSAGAYERSLNSRSSLPRATGSYTKMDRWIFVARRKRQRTRGSSAQRCRRLGHSSRGKGAVWRRLFHKVLSGGFVMLGAVGGV
ncbi:hypothetical protein [Vreelandella boliviensis]|uniref:hypothetical protein n=1 Tax=Vreelandella boliviensis TaxID=223527 RepID=UPI001B8D189D|nr:hypothetical protein [Halomonas boliviensis]MBS3667166.1 hypothetical protein [Halomonas boliviensis]